MSKQTLIDEILSMIDAFNENRRGSATAHIANIDAILEGMVIVPFDDMDKIIELAWGEVSCSEDAAICKKYTEIMDNIKEST